MASKRYSSNHDQKDFTHFIGETGPWQKRIFWLFILGNMITTLNHMSIGFFSKSEEHWCSKPDTWSATSDWRPQEVSNETQNGTFSQCEIYTEENLVNKRACYRWDYATNASTVIQEWNLVCGNEWLLSLCQAVYMAGFLSSVLFSGQMADIFGRHPLMMANIYVFIFASLAEGFSSSFVMFTIMRFLIGFGNAGFILISYIILIEAMGPTKRSTMGFLHGVGGSIGYACLPLIAWYFQKNWREFQLVISLPALALTFLHWLIPESPRWLLSHRKHEKAKKILQEAARKNNKTEADLEKFLKIHESKMQAMAPSGQATVLDLFKTSNLRKKTIILQFTWMVISFVYYGLSLSTTDNLGGDYYWNFFFLGAVEIPSTILCIASQRLGRKWPFLISLLMSGFSCLGCAAAMNGPNWIISTFAIIGKFFVSSAFSLAYVYSAEIYPTVARNVGVGSCSTMARIGSMIAPFMKELGSVTYPFVPMVIFGVLPIICAALAYMLPETHEQPIPETLEDAENFEMDMSRAVELKPMLSNIEESGYENDNFVSSGSDADDA